MNSVKLLHIKCCYFQFFNSSVALKNLKKVRPPRKVEMTPLLQIAVHSVITLRISTVFNVLQVSNCLVSRSKTTFPWMNMSTLCCWIVPICYMRWTHYGHMGWIMRVYRRFLELKLYPNSLMPPCLEWVREPTWYKQNWQIPQQSQETEFLPHWRPTITQLWSNADDKLFQKIQDNPHHVLYKLLPMKSNTGYNLRTRKHPILPPC